MRPPVMVLSPVSDINMSELLEFHKKHGKIATLTAVHVEQRFGVLEIDHSDETVRAFREKTEVDGSRINAGYMVLEPGIFDYIEGDDTVFEKETISRLVSDGELDAYRHDGFWQCMDTKREKDQLESMIASNRAPWMVWQNH